MNTVACMPDWRRWSTVALFAAAMAWVESAVVFYLRTMMHRVEPYQPNPLPFVANLGTAELVREAATLVMLLLVGILAGNTWRSRLGYAAVAFGVWDILYYAFLKVICDWPHSLLDWDILFLLPLPWWGPVLAPVLIALLMIVWGTFASQFERAHPPALSDLWIWALNFMGVALALFVFMTDTLAAASRGVVAVRTTLPAPFNWPAFLAALGLMAAPAVRQCWHRWLQRRTRPEILNSAESLPCKRSLQN